MNELSVLSLTAFLIFGIPVLVIGLVAADDMSLQDPKAYRIVSNGINYAVEKRIWRGWVPAGSSLYLGVGEGAYRWHKTIEKAEKDMAGLKERQAKLRIRKAHGIKPV